LAVLREKLALKQSDLARIGGVALSSIQSIEGLRLGLSKQLAARISVATGCDLNWLLNGDATDPMPPLAPQLPYPVGDGEEQDYVATINILVDGFCRMFAAARRLDCGAQLRLAWTQSTIEQGLRVLRAEL
jgi:hypothetical protein